MTFNRLDGLFGSRKRGRRVEAGRYWAGPVLRCGKCGNQLTGEVVNDRGQGMAWAEPPAILRLQQPAQVPRGRPAVPGLSVPAEDIHDLLEAAVMQWVETPAARRAAARAGSTGEVGRRGPSWRRSSPSCGSGSRSWGQAEGRHISPARYAGPGGEAAC